MLNKPNMKRLDIFKKAAIRFLKMFSIGIMLNTTTSFAIRNGVRLEELRILGVLQRIALCYLILASIEILLYKPIKIENFKSIKYYFADLIWY